MKTNVTFRHFKGHHPVLRDLAMQAAEHFEKFHNSIISTDIEFINETDKIVEFTLFVQGKTLIVKESSDDFKKSLGKAEDKMVRQLKKYKEKIQAH